MLHFNAAPTAALKSAAAAAEEDVYKVLILDRATKVGVVPQGRRWWAESQGRAAG